ncbi:MAG: YdeI/OmpD-associated family protein [Rhizobiaceae bacterium]|nr:YdeI/OmpD-associated family protein [Rhizobiaceae bacterium]
MAPVHVDPKKMREFEDEDAFYRWLGDNHDTADELWIRIFKKGSGRKSIDAKQAIDVILCWGWIDGIRKSWDEHSFVQRYVPRRPKSVWSKINVDNVARLVRDGRMTEHGMKQVELARADGRWDRAYGSGRNLTLPDEMLAAIEAEPAAKEMLGRLTEQNRFALAFRVHNVKTEATRQKKIAEFVAMLARGETIYPQKAEGPARKRKASGGAAGGRNTGGHSRGKG